MSRKPSQFEPGGDARAIAEIAKSRYGGFRELFEAHGWDAPGNKLMTSAPGLIVAHYGSVAEFVRAHSKADEGDIWEQGYSVLLTSYWGWTPETWGTVGWTGERGLTRRTNLLKELTDPFITVCYVTSNKNEIDRDLKGKIAGFYLMSHRTGDRDEFTHPIHFQRSPEKWRHSLRALRAFSYLPEYRLDVRDFDEEVLRRAQAVSSMGEIISDPDKLARLTLTPYAEVDVFSENSSGFSEKISGSPSSGFVTPGPASRSGYVVAGGSEWLPRELYILRLAGDVDAFLGYPSEGRSIFKVGLSASPESRRQALQKSMPLGSFKWEIERTTKLDGCKPYPTHTIAVRGENAMKRHLANSAKWLGGEFYLANSAEIERSWQMGCEAAGAALVKGEAT